MSVLLCQVLLSLIISVVTIIFCYFLVSRAEKKDDEQKPVIPCDKHRYKPTKIVDLLMDLPAATPAVNHKYKIIGRKCENNKENRKYLNKCDANNKYAKRLIEYLSANRDSMGRRKGEIFMSRAYNALYVGVDCFQTEIFAPQKNSPLSYKKARLKLHTSGLLTISNVNGYASTTTHPRTKERSCLFYRFNLEKIKKLLTKNEV